MRGPTSTTGSYGYSSENIDLLRTPSSASYYSSTSTNRRRTAKNVVSPSRAPLGLRSDNSNFSFATQPATPRPAPSSWATHSAEWTSEETDGVAIAIMGATGSGKTTFINLISGSNLRVGEGLKSCTSVVQMAVPFEIGGRSVTLIDTPGFDDTTKSDTDILKLIAGFLETSYEQGKKLAGIIYMHRISDFRMGGISTRNFRMFRQLCGESTLKNVVIVTNMWGQVSPSVGEARERELATEDMFFKPVLDKGAQLVRHDNTFGSAQVILQLIVPNKPEALRIQRELVDEHMDISQTAAAEELNRELMEQARRHRAELKGLEEEMKIAIKQQDEETRKELEEEYRKLHKEMERVQNDSQRLATEYNEEKRRMEEKMRDMAEQAKRDNEAAALKYEQQLKGYQQELEAKSAAFAQDKRMLEQRMEEAAAQRKKDEAAAQAKLDAQIKALQDQAKISLEASAAEKAALEKSVRDLAEKSKKENEDAAARHRQEMKAYQDQLANAQKATAADKANMERAMEDIRRRNEQERRSRASRSSGWGGLFTSVGRALDSIFGW
ncbi:P-loop containing nucleoside triphosphate hydrolase protein [Collybia nuda]|uniref:P-loop containing nucleoside triphosphate hydrolase protein n=1 Tax=Collybia nuda TaxID=64659 RepID=A0A9P5YD02_9AGAR|nr:P-loop containing nucleoside triphosphate hydrolase protein [Collybia nuda]